MADDQLVQLLERCIGCGLCVSTCPVEAITMIEREKDQIPIIPANWVELTERQHKEMV